MNILVVGGGGREHAIIKKIKENKKVKKIYALPGNGGISNDALCIDIPATDVEKIVDFAKKNQIDFAIIGPDNPLALGIVDALERVGIKSFGPSKKASIIESSKSFSKKLMEKYNISTAKYQVFENYNSAINFVEGFIENKKIVIKADGLALGKGVFICNNKQEAKNSIKSIMKDKVFGNSGNKIIIEEFLDGKEVSVLAFTDGKTIVPMISSMDHKRAFDNDKGLNTGGMGAIAPNPYYTKSIADECMKKIFVPTIEAMNKENRIFKGCLYFGLIITSDGVKVIEYNCRFGDPETQAVLPLLKTDLLEIMIACENQTLDKVDIEFSNKASCCVVAASEGYPKKYNTGYQIEIEKDFAQQVYYAGVKKDNDKLITSGGRVLAVSSQAENLKTAITNAYDNLEKIKFKNIYYRTDIGKYVNK